MAYSSGGLIQASDYNTLITSINSIYGQGTGNTGYGGANTGPGSTEPSSSTIELLPTLSSSTTISYRAWLDLRNAYADCLLHQNQPLEVQQLGSTTPTYTLGQTMGINSNTVTVNSGYISQTSGVAATYTNGQTIVINTITVTLSTGTTVTAAITDITAAAITGITATDVGGALEISSTTVNIVLTEGSGTALADLGFTAGTYNLVAAPIGIVNDVNTAAITGVTAVIEAAAAKIISTVDLILAEGTGALSGSGFTAGTYKALPLTTSMDDTTDIATFFTELLTADQGGDLRRNDDNLIANAQVHTGEGFTTTSSGGLGSSVRTTAWSVQIEHELSITFTSQDAARYFFNTGGDLRLSATRTDGSATAQNTSWTDILTAAGTYSFTTTEYFALTTTYATVVTYEDTSTGPYDLPSPNTWFIQAKTNTITDPGGRGGKGNIISFRSVFMDQHVGTGGGPDSVDGTLTSYVDEKRATNIFVKPQPVYALITALTVGS